MSSLSRFHLLLAFIAIMLLRVAIGFHFFQEGTAKLNSGDFTAEYFLRSARGPFAPFFHSLLDDGDGKLRLCVTESTGIQDEPVFTIDPELTLAIWDDFIDRATGYYSFGNPEIEASLVQRRGKIGEQIRLARTEKAKTVDTLELESKRRSDQADILRLREQPQLANKILDTHEEELRTWLEANRQEIVAHYQSRDRLQGFDRDGSARGLVARQVSGLREQIETIRQQRQQQLEQWTSEIEAMWYSLELQVNGLAVADQKKNVPLALHRPFLQKYSKLQTINRIVPWFDVVVGALLIIGLFTRLASLAGAAFLASVIATQPPWFPGTVPTYYQGVELLALLVLFATCAGRLGGLDYFFSRTKRVIADVDD